jgi:hypothetical protein
MSATIKEHRHAVIFSPHHDDWLGPDVASDEVASVWDFAVMTDETQPR